MGRKKYKSVKRALFYLIFTGIVIITTFLSLLQIESIKLFIENEKENIKSKSQNAASAYIHGWDLIYLLIENETQHITDEIYSSVSEKYEKQKNWDFSLEEFLKTDEHMDIHIIDRNNVIIKSTDPGSIGLDFNKFEKMDQHLNQIRTTGKSDIDGIGSSAIDGSVMNLIYKPTKDKEYVIEIAVKLEEYAEKLVKIKQGRSNLNKVVARIRDNAEIVDLKYYDSFGTRYNLSYYDISNKKERNIPDENKAFFQEARDTGEVVSIDRKINGKTLTEDFVPYKIIIGSEEAVGVINITYDFSYINRDMMTAIKLIIALAVLCILIFTYVIWRKADKLMKPIDKLVGAMNQVAAGKYNVKVDINTNNEFQILGDNFNNMVEVIDINKRAVTEQRDEIAALYEEQIAISEELEEALDANKKTYFETIKALAKAIDAKDHYTKGHCNRVMNYSILIAKEMGFLDCQLDDLKYGAILHDIGKIGIPEEILNKNGRLTDEEYNIIKSHTAIGYEIIKDIEFLSTAKEIVYQHHERIDGRGYPNNLEGENSNIFSRIVCVADSFDAMTSTRAYRKSMKLEDAVSELEKGKGTQFDPEVVDIFIKLIKDNKLEL